MHVKTRNLKVMVRGPLQLSSGIGHTSTSGDVGDLLVFSGHRIVIVLATSALLELINCGGNVHVGNTLIFSGKSEEDMLSH